MNLGLLLLLLALESQWFLSTSPPKRSKKENSSVLHLNLKTPLLVAFDST